MNYASRGKIITLSAFCIARCGVSFAKSAVTTAIAKAAAGALFAVGMVVFRDVEFFGRNLHAQRIVQMEADRLDHEGHAGFPRLADLQFLAGHAVGLAVFDKVRACFEPVEIHAMAFAFFVEQLDPFETAWTGAVVVFAARTDFFYLS